MIDRIRPQPGNDIREMETRPLVRKVTFYTIIGTLAFVSWLVTTSGTWANSIALVGTVAGYLMATPGAIELHTRSDGWLA